MNEKTLMMIKLDILSIHSITLIEKELLKTDIIRDYLLHDSFDPLFRLFDENYKRLTCELRTSYEYNHQILMECIKQEEDEKCRLELFKFLACNNEKLRICDSKKRIKVKNVLIS